MKNETIQKIANELKTQSNGLFLVKNLELRSLGKIAQLAKIPTIGVFVSPNHRLCIEIKGKYSQLPDLMQLETDLLKTSQGQATTAGEDIVITYQNILTDLLYGETALSKSYPVLVDTNIFDTSLRGNNGETFSVGLENVR